MTTVPPVHNYENQIVFSNQSNNIKSNDIINFTIAPSGDDCYFDLYKSRITFKLKITGLAPNNGDNAVDKTLLVPVKKNTSGIVNNTKVTYTYFDGDTLKNLPLSADNENIGMIRGLLNAITDNKHNHVVNENIKELSYIYYDAIDNDINKTSNAAELASRPYNGQLFYNKLKFIQKKGSTEAYCTINVNFSDIFEGCSQERFINLTQMDAQIIPTNDDAFFYIENDQIDINGTKTKFGGVFFDTCKVWYHSYKTSADDVFDPEDTQLVKNQIMTKTFNIPAKQKFVDNNVIVNFPIKMMFMLFTDENGDFSKLKDVKFSNLTLKIAGETARPINVDNSNTPEGIDHTFFEWMDYLCNSRSDEFDTLLTYKTWINQFKIYAFPISEWYPQKATNTLQFEINFENPPSADKTTQMHLIMIRANNA